VSDTIHYLKFGVTACLLPGVPKDWPPNHKWVSDDQVKEVNCPSCLKGMEYGDPTFQILEDGKAIKCCRCGSISHNKEDVENHFVASATPATTTSGRQHGGPGCRATPSRHERT
jgi:hypothetical protein